MLSSVFFLLTVFISGSHQQCFSSNDTSPALGVDKYNVWVDSRHSFDVSLFQILNREKAQENLIFSPSSVYEFLLMTYFGAAHETEASLAEVLHKPLYMEKSELWRSYRTERLTYSEERVSSRSLRNANKLFFSNKLHLRPCIQENLKTETELIDYQTDAEWARNYINNWVATVTEGEIKEPIEILYPSTKMIVANAVYFKDKWLKEFNPNETEYMPFKVNTKEQKPTKMMVKKDNFHIDYHEAIKTRMLKLPYQGEKQAMIILLPDVDDVDSLIGSLNSNVINSITGSTKFNHTIHIKVAIPKYEARNNIKLNQALSSLGIGNTLSPEADLSRFTGEKGVFFTDVVQEAVIKVDEEGTKAAAATLGIVTLTSVIGNYEPEPFICDRPFVYFIYDYFRRKTLFMGTFRYPAKE